MNASLIFDQLAMKAGERHVAKEHGVTEHQVRQIAAEYREALRLAKQAIKAKPVPRDTRTLTGRAFGDPLPGRSALDARA